MIREVQRVYRLQGVEINDKHVEMIVRQMLKKIRVEESGDSEVLPGTSMDVLDFNEMNEKLIAEGKKPAEGKQVMLGITKASLATDSFLSDRVLGNVFAKYCKIAVRKDEHQPVGGADQTVEHHPKAPFYLEFPCTINHSHTDYRCINNIP